MKKILSDTLVLVIITLVAGFLLGGVYEITKKPREAQEEKTKQAAYKKVFSEKGVEFKEYEYDKKAMSDYLKDNKISEKKAEINEIVKAVSSGKEIGYVITVTDHEGYGGDIQFTLGITTDGTITGISYLSIEETAGVGMKVTQKGFTNQFKGKKVDSIVYTKNGASADNEIDAISGATVSTNAVTNGVNAGLLAYQYITNNQKGEVTNE